MNLTRQERQVVLFLLGVALAGLGINALTKHSAQIRVVGYVSADFGRVNLNQAGIEALTSVKGIGPSLAQRIIDYRNVNGQYQCVSELINIRGIGQSKYEAIKEYFTVE